MYSFRQAKLSIYVYVAAGATIQEQGHFPTPPYFSIFENLQNISLENSKMHTQRLKSQWTQITIGWKFVDKILISYEETIPYKNGLFHNF